MNADLFDQVYNPPALAARQYNADLPVRGSDTRKLAHQAASRTASQVAVACINVLRRNPAGLTPDEIAERIGKSVLSVRPRISELKRAGLIKDSGARRLARAGSGTSQAVFVAVREGAR